MAGREAEARQNVAKNHLIGSREKVKRFPLLAALCRKFVQTFEHDAVDPKHGKLKYKALLQKAANRQLETVFIDLSDLKQFCEREKAIPDDGIMADLEISKIAMQQAIEEMVTDVEGNAYRFQRYFYEACAAEIPEQDEDTCDASEARAVMRRWRERNAKETGGSDIPMKLQHDFDVRFRPRDDFKASKVREIRAACVGALVQVECVVVRTSQVKPKVDMVTYSCEVCGAEIFLSVQNDRYTPLTECPGQKCKDNKVAGKLKPQIRTSHFTKCQEMKVQEMSMHVPDGGVPRSITVMLGGDLTRMVLPGDAITVTGVFAPAQLPWFKQRGPGATMQDMYVDAHCIQKHKSGYNEQAEDQTELERQVMEATREGNMFERCARSIAPEIFGLVDVKKALLLVLIGSFTKTMKDGMRIRGDIHTLLMGDPGLAKSQLLNQVKNIAPRSVYATGKGSSGVGLTASVIRDNATGEVTLEGGALVIADMGICCIDEFDKMEEGDRTAIHEVMEQQTVSIAKAGITTTLNARTTVLAAANPVGGRYNPYKSPVENIDLPASLLSRFDLLFLMLDTVEAEKDRNLAHHVCKTHTRFIAAEQKRAPDEAPPTAGDLYEEKPFDANFMRMYIRKARQLEPLITDAIQKDIVNAYVSIRDEEKTGEVDNRKSYTTPRTLLAILRLSQAHARARLSERVEQQDFDEAMRLMKASKESVELAKPSKNKENPLDLVYDVIADLSRRETSGDGWVDMAHVVSMAGHKAMSTEQVHEAIDNWEGLSVLSRNEEKTMVKFLVPPA